MKKSMVILCTMLLVFGVVGIGNATLIDFESTGLIEGDALTTQIDGVTFYNAIIAEVGGPLYALL